MLQMPQSASDAWVTTTAKRYLLHSVCKGIAHPVIHRPMKGVMNSHHSARCKSLERSAWAVEMRGIATNQANSNATRVNAKLVRSKAILGAAETPHSVWRVEMDVNVVNVLSMSIVMTRTSRCARRGNVGFVSCLAMWAAVVTRRFAIREPTAPDAGHVEMISNVMTPTNHSVVAGNVASVIPIPIKVAKMLRATVSSRPTEMCAVCAKPMMNAMTPTPVSVWMGHA